MAEDLGRAHTALLADLRALSRAIRPLSGISVPDLRDRLVATRAHVAKHFRFEEQNGYLEAARKREPRLAHAIQQLAEEHRQLTQSLEALIGKTEATAEPGAPLREEIHKWIGHVRQHEIRENNLIQDVFTQDIGAED